MGEVKWFNIPWPALTPTLRVLYNKLDVASKDERKEILDAWRHCQEHGHINGHRAPKEIREFVGNVAEAIRVHIATEAHTHVRKEIRAALERRAKR